MRQILLTHKKSFRRINVPDHVHEILAVYKVFFPPETTVKLGKGKIVFISEINPWPPPEQVDLLKIEPVKEKRKTNFA